MINTILYTINLLFWALVLSSSAVTAGHNFNAIGAANMAIHIFDTSGEAYDAVMCDSTVKRGDVLYIPSEDIVGLAYTWPVALTEAHGQLHRVTAAESLTGDAAILATIKFLTEAE